MQFSLQLYDARAHKSINIKFKLYHSLTADDWLAYGRNYSIYRFTFQESLCVIKVHYERIFRKSYFLSN